MKAFFLFTLTSLLGASAPSFAADVIKQPEPVPAAAAPSTATNWSGIYLGAYTGGSFGDNKLKNLSGSTDVNLSTTGFITGGLIGANYQFDSAVVGVEGEFGYNGWSEGKDYLNSSAQSRFAKSEGTYTGRLRGRVGYAFDNVLLYAAGGASFADDKVTQSNTAKGVSDSIRKNLVGWNIGAGTEVALSAHWIGRVEYIFDSYGKKTYNFKSLPGTFADRQVSLSDSSVRVAVEYKF